MENQKHFLVSADAVPPVFSKVLKAKELLAQALCHEINHLDGVLFVDLMEPGTMEYIDPNNQK